MGRTPRISDDGHELGRLFRAAAGPEASVAPSGVAAATARARRLRQRRVANMSAAATALAMVGLLIAGLLTRPDHKPTRLATQPGATSTTGSRPVAGAPTSTTRPSGDGGPAPGGAGLATATTSVACAPESGAPIVAVGTGAGGPLTAYDPGGCPSRVLDGQETADPSYANDRTQIAYWCHGVCVVHPDGSGRRVLSADNGVLPSWAGDDSHLAYVNQRDNRGTVTIITPSSAAPVASTGPGTSAIEVRPAWAADGSAVAFAAGPAPATGPVGSTDIYTLTVAGVTTRVTTARDSGASDRPLGWTNDHRIVFNRHGADDHPIGYYVVDAAAGATPTRVSDAGGDGALSPDGRRLAVATATGLTVVELATGSATTLAVKSPAVVLWSPNGRALAGTNPDGLYRVAADGSTNPTYYIGESSLPRWGPDSDRIAFRGRRTQEAVWELNVVGPNMTSSLVVGSVGQGACCLGRYTW